MLTLALLTTAALAFEGVYEGSTWTYHDSGGDPNSTKADWYDPAFDDSGWSTGAAPLGFGGPLPTQLNNHGGLTYYFRIEFEVASAAAITDAFLDISYDDGAIAYLNGNEIDRWDMPSKGVDYATAATGGTSSPIDESGVAVDPAFLTDGTNVLAIEVHQWTAKSSDLYLEALLSLSPHILAGPYLLEPAEDGVAIMWETYGDAAAQADYGTTSAYGSQATDSTVSSLHRVELSGLSADTDYHYQVTADGYSSADHVFHTQQAAGSSDLLFVAYGDSRSNPDIHGALADLILAEDPAFVVNTGDLVGRGSTQSEWYLDFFEPVLAFSPTHAMAAVPGNHDHEEYFPGSYYWDYLPSGSATTDYWSTTIGPALFLFLDSCDPDFNGTTKYCHADGVLTTDECADAAACEDGSGVTWTCEEDPSVSAQYLWLESELAKAVESWIFVVQHHPAYSSGMHATDDEVGVFEAWLAPMLEYYGVTAMLVGHDHRYERSYANGTHYLTLGGGGASIHGACTDPSAPPDRCANDYQIYALDSYCYGVFDITGGEVWLDVFDETGAAIESGSVLLSNDVPTITVDEPDGDCDTVDEELVIAYTASDPDSDADIAFYLDSDGADCDGTLLVDGISEDDGLTEETVDVSGVAEGEYYVYALIEDELEQTCAYGAGPVRIDHPRTSADVLLPLGSEWTYWDGGSMPPAWSRPGFNDSFWSTGCAELGFGEGDEQTEVASGETTVYFRTEFEFDGTLPSSLAMEAALDDGAAIYLNGRPVHQVNMPWGLPTYSTLANLSAEGEPQRFFQLHPTAPSRLIVGTNTLAVEVHQWNAASTDLSWDCRLLAIP